MRKIRIASRKSDLARIQAYMVGEAIHKNLNQSANSNMFSDDIEYIFKSSLGDINLTDPLWKMPQKGVFTQDFVQDLVSGQVDMIVHSWKDLPTDRPDETVIAATLKRADQRDLMLVKKSSRERIQTSQRLNLFSSSLRRQYNLEKKLVPLLPYGPELQIQFHDVRGNINTRLEKLLADPVVDGLILAKAAWDRMTTFGSGPEAAYFLELQKNFQKLLENFDWTVLPLHVNPNAAAQGGLAIEVRCDDTELIQLLNLINHDDSYQSIAHERGILQSYGGGCHQKLGMAVLRRVYSGHPHEIIRVKGVTDDQQTVERFELRKISDSAALSATAFENIKPDQVFTSSEIKNYFEFKENPQLISDSTNRSELELYEALKKHPVYLATHSRVVSYLSGLNQKGLLNGHVIWASGLATWKALAEAGIWVQGSFEGLGDQESMMIENLLSSSEARPAETSIVLRFSYLHDSKESYVSVYENRLKTENTLDIKQKLTGKSYFYWSSFTHFKICAQLQPSIREGRHFSGPGRTHRGLVSENLTIQPEVCLSERQWKEKFK